MENREIEVRFLEIDKEKLISRLLELGAKDYGESLLNEVILDKGTDDWNQNATDNKFVRVREGHGKTYITYKHHQTLAADGTEEIELEINDFNKAVQFLEKVGLKICRHQQKLRHKFSLNGVVVDIDTWPKIPTYVELEGESEESLKEAAAILNLDWDKVVFKDAKKLIEENYNIPIRNIKWFTFDRFE